MKTIKKITWEVSRASDRGVFHDARADARLLGKAINDLVDKVNEIIDSHNKIIQHDKETTTTQDA